MSLSKQAKTLTSKQSDLVINYLTNTRSPIRNKLIFLLSTKAGLRAKEISSLTWNMVLDSNSDVSSSISITNNASKGRTGGREIPLNKHLKEVIVNYYEVEKSKRNYSSNNFIINTQRSKSTTPQAIVNMFQGWYKDLNLIGCSSHSGRRTFITNCSRKISTVGGSLRDVQHLAGHSSLQTTQGYIEGNSLSKTKVVDII